MPPTPQFSPNDAEAMSALTVTCHQCGAADMTRLDRKEYRCNHCGAVTLISDGDAERLEQLLMQMFAKQNQQLANPIGARTRVMLLSVVGVVFLAAILGLVLVTPHHSATGVTSVASYFDKTTVPTDRIVVSPLTWIPDGQSGAYNGLIYNHSGYAITPPSYTLALFHDGMKDGSASSIPSLITLEPGEYMPVSFSVFQAKANARYELVQPDHIMRSTYEVVPMPLQSPSFVHEQRSFSYALTGTVQNDRKRPIFGVGLVMLYGKDGHLVGSGIGSVPDLNPGEKATINMNAILPAERSDIAAYEYLLDVQYKNERQSVSMEDIEKLGSATVPNRIVRVDHPQLIVTPSTF